MAVYTHVSADDVRALLADYDIGALVAHEGVAQGVENTNYILVTDRGNFVLTLFERRVDAEDLPYFLGLMAHVAARGVPAPAPVADRKGVTLRRVRGRPAVIITFLEGKARMTPGPAECREAGALLARLHVAGADFAMSRRNALALEGWRAIAARTGTGADRCAAGLASLIDTELAALGPVWPTGLPQGAAHADLFPDNVFFEGATASGAIDFYFACTEQYAYDLAICLDSWCFPGRRWRADSAAAMIDGYRSVRALNGAELAALPKLMRGAALRFLLTRLFDFLHQVDDAVVTVKDPLEYRDLLVFLKDAGPESLYGPPA